MLCFVDQSLMLLPLRRRELGVDLGAHTGLDRVEARADLRPEGIGLGTVPLEDRAHRVPLRGTEIQLTAQVGDDGVWAVASAHSGIIALGGRVATPTCEAPRQKNGGEQSHGSEFRFIQHGSSMFL